MNELIQRLQRAQTTIDELVQQRAQAVANRQATTERIQQLDTMLAGLQDELKSAKKALKDAL